MRSMNSFEWARWLDRAIQVLQVRGLPGDRIASVTIFVHEFEPGFWEAYAERKLNFSVERFRVGVLRMSRMPTADDFTVSLYKRVCEIKHACTPTELAVSSLPEPEVDERWTKL